VASVAGTSYSSIPLEGQEPLAQGLVGAFPTDQAVGNGVVPTLTDRGLHAHTVLERYGEVMSARRGKRSGEPPFE
jgi:hypothetical protein